jgi:hypothetical protein
VEEHTPLIGASRRSLLSFSNANELYEFAVDHVRKFRQREFDTTWSQILAASSRSVEDQGAHFFFKEYTWCVYVSGFRAAHVSKRFKELLQAHEIEDAQGTYLEPKLVSADMSKIRAVWKNKAKATAVVKTRIECATRGWPTFSRVYASTRTPIQLSFLPFMGPALSHHLARNLGNLNVVKPDVHLIRLASHYGYKSALEMCQDVSIDPPGKTDLILWFCCVDNITRS